MFRETEKKKMIQFLQKFLSFFTKFFYETYRILETCNFSVSHRTKNFSKED